MTYNRADRDELARELYVNAMAGAVGLGEMTHADRGALYDQVADIALHMADRFIQRALNTPA